MDAQYLDRHFSRDYFDTVVLSGVFGYGVDTEAQQDAVLSAIRAVLKPDGLLVLGWNKDKSHDPVRRAIVCGFRRVAFMGPCSHKEFKRSTHVFDFFRNDLAPGSRFAEPVGARCIRE